MWEDSGRTHMEKILKRHGHEREVKKAKHQHMNVNEFKESQDSEKLKQLSHRSREKLTPSERTAELAQKLKQENSLLKVENVKLEKQKHSLYKSFYYSDSAKQAFIQEKLSERQIPFRETENGFEAQECYVGEIRTLEKEYKPVKSHGRETLREHIDKFLMQSNNFEELLSRLQKQGYEIKQNPLPTIKQNLKRLK
jgi:hypothetical protein